MIQVFSFSDMKNYIHQLYKKFIRPFLKSHMSQQRVKLVLWDVFSYFKLFGLHNMTFSKKFSIVWKCILTDWNVPHAHKPIEIIPILIEISERKGNGMEVFVEAGCWLGGSTIKFSLLCEAFNYPLHVFDSFAGVEFNAESSEEESRFFGEYVGPLDQVRNNVKTFGCLEVCTFHKGWFEDTMREVQFPVRLAYIDCDLSKGTKEVLSVVVPNLSKDGIVYTQDYQITSLRKMLHETSTWTNLNLPVPTVNHIARNLATLKF